MDRKATVLTESFCFSFVFKPINSPWQSPGLSQIDASLFSPIYPFSIMILVTVGELKESDIEK
jgi:hypothetical protein